ncbi:reverse transcriptase domain, Reverse transcriptase zinc-binding domain protein [Artemisia annua]|uniref:Reverse transcriptase domain, Reverse transcriptase zinc-binding domain protein n=1 Tax=Artemisia annua TaxID=35608 RepID=A0A2U1NIG6_ARTAN|nr:reverse transcriptase domain, Reverse transcriptase zinc-binding domain protein [Artemisia annua]
MGQEKTKKSNENINMYGLGGSFHSAHVADSLSKEKSSSIPSHFPRSNPCVDVPDKQKENIASSLPKRKDSTTKPKCSLPSKTTSVSTSDPIEHSDSLSKINRCNFRILKNLNSPSNSNQLSESISNEVEETINVGLNLGFDMLGKDNDIAIIVRSASGKSGGLLAVWDKRKFASISTTIGDGFLAVLGSWQAVDIPCLFVVVYDPQDQKSKLKLWDNIEKIIALHDTLSVILGDFNKVRFASERKCTNFNHIGSSHFNSFISNAGLSDLPLGGKRFTRMNNLGSQLSKLDRILVSSHFMDRWPNSNVLALPPTSLELNFIANTIGCQPSNLPCIYLGLPIGADMSRCANWTPIINRFHNRLSMWKAKNLSFGGRLTLIKSVLGSLGVYYFSSFKAPISVINKLETIRRRFFWGGNIEENKIAWIAWDKIMSPLDQGGLGVGSLRKCNQAMLCKWWWRYRVENDATWCKLIRSIHGVEGGFRNPPHSGLHTSPWRQIVKLENDLVSYGISLPSVFKKKIGNGCNTLFWLDTWIGNEPLKDSFPRLFRLESNPSALVCDRAPVSTSSSNLASGAAFVGVHLFSRAVMAADNYETIWMLELGTSDGLLGYFLPNTYVMIICVVFSLKKLIFDERVNKDSLRLSRKDTKRCLRLDVSLTNKFGLVESPSLA